MLLDLSLEARTDLGSAGP